MLNDDKDVIEYIKNNDPPVKFVPYLETFVSRKKGKLYVKRNLNKKLFVCKRSFCDLKNQTLNIMHVLYGDKGNIEYQNKKNLFLSKKYIGFFDRCAFKMLGMKFYKCVICMNGPIQDNKNINNVIKYINSSDFSHDKVCSDMLSSYEKSCKMSDKLQQDCNNHVILCKYKCKINNVVAICNKETKAIVSILPNYADTIGKVKISQDKKK